MKKLLPPFSIFISVLILFCTVCKAQTFPFNGSIYYVNGPVGSTQKLVSISNYPTNLSSSVVCNFNNKDYYNAIAANPVDGYIYYRSSTTGDLSRLDASGNSTVVATNVLGATVSGTFDNLGRFIFMDQANGNVLSYLNLNTGLVTKKIPTPCPVRDLIFNPTNCCLYIIPTAFGAQKPKVYQIDSTGTVINSINYSAFFPNNGLAYGRDGRIYGIDGGTDIWYANLNTGVVSAFTNTLTLPAQNIPHVDLCSFIRKTLTVNAGANKLSGCTPLNINFTGTGVADSVLSYSWNFGDGSTSTLKNPSHTYTTAGTYTVILTLNDFSYFDGPCGMFIPNTSTLVVTVNPGPSLNIANVNSVTCFGLSNGSAAANISGGTGPYNFIWSNGQTTQNATGLSGGTHTLTVADANGCITNTTVLIATPNVLVANITTPGAVCVNQLYTINSIAGGGTGNLSYVWQPGSQTGISIALNPATAGTVYYSLTVTDANNCSVLVTHSLIAYAYPNLSINSSPSVCLGQTANLSATGAYSYFWSNGVNASSTTVTPLVNTTFTLTGYNEIGCATLKTVEVFVNQLPGITITNLPNASCLPLCLDLKSSSNSEINSYVWTVNKETAGTNTYLNNYCFDEPGMNAIELQVTDKKGCSNTTKATVETYPKPHASFETGGVYSTDEPEVTFTDNSWDNIKSHFWYFGDGTTSSLSNPIHLFKDEPVTYKTFLVVKNTYGCADTAVKEIKIEQIPVIYVPNGFTPNGDGLNDNFSAKGVAIKDFKMQVFDRWGEKIFESNDISNGWDGSIKGKEIKNDTYTWLIDYSTIKGKANSIAGSVTLIR